MAAKQILKFIANKASEEEAQEILHKSGVEIKAGLNLVTVNEKGQLINQHKQIVTASISSITGFQTPAKAPKSLPKVVAGAVPQVVAQVKAVSPIQATAKAVSPIQATANVQATALKKEEEKHPESKIELSE